MVKPTVEVEGLRKLNRQLRDLTERAQQREVYRSAGEPVAQLGAQLAPSGLSSSVKPLSRAREAIVQAGNNTRLRWAGRHHFGDPGGRDALGRRRGAYGPDPFLYDAADQRRSQVVEAFQRGIEKAIRESGLE